MESGPPTLPPGNFMDLLLRDPDVPPMDAPRYPGYHPNASNGPYLTNHMSQVYHPLGLGAPPNGAPQQSPMQPVGIMSTMHSPNRSPSVPMQSPIKSVHQSNFAVQSPIKPLIQHSGHMTPVHSQASMSMPAPSSNNLPSMQQLANSVRHPNSHLPPLSSSSMQDLGHDLQMHNSNGSPFKPATNPLQSPSPGMQLEHGDLTMPDIQQMDNALASRPASVGTPMIHHLTGSSLENSNSPAQTSQNSEASLSPGITSDHSPNMAGLHHMIECEQKTFKKSPKQKTGRSPKQQQPGQPGTPKTPRQRAPRSKSGESVDSMERIFTCHFPNCGKTFTLDTNARRHERLAHKFFRGKSSPE